MLQSYGIARSWTLEQFLAARVLTGCFAGNSPISKAYLADRGSVGNKGDLVKYLAWKDAASTLGEQSLLTPNHVYGLYCEIWYYYY